MRSGWLLAVVFVVLGCGGDDDAPPDCSEWLAWRDGPAPDAGLVYADDGGIIGVNLGNDVFFGDADARCFEMYPP